MTFRCYGFLTRWEKLHCEKWIVFPKSHCVNPNQWLVALHFPHLRNNSLSIPDQN